MNWKKWTTGGILIIVFLIYPSCRHQDMVVAWLKPGGDSISPNASWIFGKYSSGRIVHARECREVAHGWEALDSLWPMSFALILVSASLGITGGYILRDNDDIAQHKRELSELEQKYKKSIEDAERSYRQATILERNSRDRNADIDQKMTDIKRWQQNLTEREQNIEKSADERVQAMRKQLLHIQEDHKNRSNKMENMEKDKLEFKRKTIALEKENIRLGEENLSLLKENMALKKEK